MSDTNKILDRIRKLLALAEGAGTPEEAGTAYATAQKLIAQHALTDEQVRIARLRETGGPVNEPIVSRIVHMTQTPQMPTWLGILGQCLADVNGCDMVQGHTFNGKSVRTLKAWGRESDLAIVEELLRIIPGQIDVLCARSLFTGRTARNNFRLGAVSMVCERLRLAARQARKAIEESAAKQDASAPAIVGEVTALALRALDDRHALATAAMRKDCPNLRTKSSSSRTDHAARAAGRAAGAQVSVTRSKALS
jgi:hypothetical protein